uniref:Centrosomal protein 112 n=1 Tax=Amphiprion percula TaxID=161767 RepID=A0A3P8SW41_AMPPE
VRFRNWVTMSKYEDSWERLDTEFDHFLLDMKPYVLKHPNKSERQRCAMWIKKLCDPAMCGSGLIGHKNRNMYARLLLHMLKRGVLEGPFTNKPEPGGLKTLPTYMSIYFDEPLGVRSAELSRAGLPDWVTGELDGSGDDSLALGLLKDRPSSTPNAAHYRYFTAKRGLKFFCLLFQIENPRYLREKPIPLSPVSCQRVLCGLFIYCYVDESTDMKIKVLEAKHQEEKLKMQQRHDADVEKILDRKNSEIEEVKSLYRAKQKESEEMIHKLEKKVQSVLRESQVICQSKEKQIAELRKLSDQSTDSLKNEWEKKLHAAVTEMEQEKFQLQKKHTENIQELLEDTNLRLTKMESEYNARSQATEQTVRELELRVKQQSTDVEKGNALRQKVTQEKAQLEIHVASLSAELQEANRRILILQKEKEQQSEQHQQTMQKLQAKHETDMSHLHQEHDLSAAKASELIEDLEKAVSKARQQLQDSEHRRQQQVRDQEIKFQQEKDEQERTRLQQQHSAEKDSLVQERQREVSSLERQARAALHQHQQHTHEWRKRDAQTISDLEIQLSALREELQQVLVQHRQQLAEVALVQEEKEQRAILDKEASLDRLRSDMERIHSNLERSHQQEKDAAQEKVNTASKSITEGQSVQKIAKTLNVPPSAVAKTIKLYDQTGL